MDTKYIEFLESKKVRFKSTGIDVMPEQIHELLFPFQADLTRWALRKGRSAIFADTGLGKTIMQLEWARHVPGKVLIFAPLSVANQTINEAKKLDMQVFYAESESALTSYGRVFITNYERIDKFGPGCVDAVVLDESSILKSIDGKTKRKLFQKFAKIKYKLCCTATPAPNDIAEIANHSEFLGILSRSEMLANFFVHDDQGWRLRGYAQQAFFEWLSSWGMAVRLPSDLGYDDDGFILPPMNEELIQVDSDYKPDDQLFFTNLGGVRDRLKVRRMTLDDRVGAAAELVNNSTEQFIVWCGLNDESTLANQMIDDGVEVTGSDSLESKVENLTGFQDEQFRVLITKAKIAGFGMNFQNCHNMIFVGLSDSWETYYQTIRRCYRFGQKSQVNVYIVLSTAEMEIYENIKEKNRMAEKMREELIANVQNYEKTELGQGNGDGFEYASDITKGDGFTLMLGDCVERSKELPDNSIDHAIFSPPFIDLYTYSDSLRDLGNSPNPSAFFEHFGFLTDELLRIMKPGRICAVHTADVPALQSKDGFIGLKDFPGQVIQLFTEKGFIYHGRVTIDKNPQAQAIRTHSKALLFVQMEKDSSWSRPAVADYLLLFRKPGDNQVPIRPVENGEITREKWIEWAHPIWYEIRETNTLQYTTARTENDDKHICPLQLDLIERSIILYSNPGETVFSPFAGIGSEIYIANQLGRKGIGIELKPSYYDHAVKNLRNSVVEKSQMTFFEVS